jgi:hypothetical protein
MPRCPVEQRIQGLGDGSVLFGVEKSREGNPRASFDLNLYPAVLRMAEIYPLIVRMGRFFNTVYFEDS